MGHMTGHKPIRYKGRYIGTLTGEMPNNDSSQNMVFSVTRLDHYQYIILDNYRAWGSMILFDDSDFKFEDKAVYEIAVSNLTAFVIIDSVEQV